MTIAKRVRVRECCIPDCTTTTRRSNCFPICPDHMLRIWKVVDGDPYQGRDGWSVPEEWNPPPPTPDELEIRRLAKRAKARELASKMGTLYALDTRDGSVKLGFTARDLRKRLTGYPPTFRLIVSVPGTRADERDIHRSLKTFRADVVGHEWYRVEGEVIRQINTWIAQANIITQQAASDIARDYESDAIMRAEFLPRFESLEQWWAAREPAPTMQLEDAAWNYRP